MDLQRYGLPPCPWVSWEVGYSCRIPLPHGKQTLRLLYRVSRKALQSLMQSFTKPDAKLCNASRKALHIFRWLYNGGWWLVRLTHLCIFFLKAKAEIRRSSLMGKNMPTRRKTSVATVEIHILYRASERALDTTWRRFWMPLKKHIFNSRKKNAHFCLQFQRKAISLTL